MASNRDFIRRAAGGKRRRGRAPAKPAFLFEALEPRLLLSADLNAAAGHVLLDGLSALDKSLAALSSTTALTTPVPFINRSVGDVAGLTKFAGLGGDPLAALRNVAADYLTAHPTDATMAGLQGAFNGLQGPAHPGVTVATSLSGGASPTLDVTLAAASTDGNSPGYSDAATQTLHLAVSVDQANPAAPALVISAASVGAHNTLTPAAGGTPVTIDLTETWAASAAAPIAYDATHDGVAAAAVTPTLNLTPGAAPAARAFALKAADTPATIVPNSQTIKSAFDNFFTELTNIENNIETAASVVFDFPFIGNNLPNALNPHVFMAPIRNEIATLETTVNSDLAASGAVLKKLQTDLVGVLSSANLLPGTAANDVIINYQTNDAPGQRLNVTTSPNFSLANVTALELDLILGFHANSALNLSTDIGLPGLGLKVLPGSQLNASVDFTLNVGVEMTASDFYLVSGVGSQTGSPVNFGVSFYLGNDQKVTQAVATIGLVQAVLTEPIEATPDQHTGLFGNIGVNLGVNDGTSLGGGVKILPAHIGSFDPTPTFSLHVNSVLQLAFGGDFQKDANGNYTDMSSFPSISATLKYSWIIGTQTVALGANDLSLAPQVELDGLSFDLGQAVTKFIEPILKPIYDVISPQPVQDLLNFLTGSMDLVPKLAKYLDFSGSGFSDTFASYSAGKTYDWFDFVVDMAADAHIISKSDAPTISGVGDAIVRVLKDLDHAYSAADALNGYSIKIPLNLRNMTFANKNLALPQFLATSSGDPSNPSDLANAGDRVVNFINSVGITDDDLSATLRSLLDGNINSPSAQAALQNLSSDFALAIADATSNGTGLNPVTKDIEDVTFPVFDNPDSILGVLFGQNVQFFHAVLGFGLTVSGKPGFDFGLPPLISVGVDFPINLVLNLGLQFGYDTKGLTDVIADPSHPEKLFDGFFFGGDPLLEGKPDFADIFNFDASVGAGLNAKAFFDAVSASIQGTIDFSAHLWLAGATPASPFVHLDKFGDGSYDISKGQLGPFDATAQGTISLDLVAKIGWGPFSDSFDYNLASLQFFKWGDPATSPQDAGPLALYHPGSRELDLYVGSTAYLRDYGKDAPLYAKPDSPDQVLANDSATYVIDVGSDNHVTIHWYNPATKAWESQSPSGPVSLIVADTGDGNNSILINNNGSNDVQTHFSGTGGVYYDPTKLSVQDASGTNSVTYPDAGGTAPGPQGATRRVGGVDVFEAAGGSTTLEGGDTNNVLVGSANAKGGTTPNDIITGGVGPNLIVLNAADATVQTGSGSTTVYAGAGNQTVRNQRPPPPAPGDTPATQGDDIVRVGPGGSFYTAFGPGGGELISSGDGANIAGGEVNHVLISYQGAGPGASTFGFDDGAGGSLGLNTLDYSGLTSSVNVNLATGIATGPGIGTETISGFNIIYGAAAPSTIVGGGTLAQGNDTIYGQSGADGLIGGPANDVIYAATSANPTVGNTIDGGGGNSVIHAGDGPDLIVAGNGDNTVFTGAGADKVGVGDGRNTIHGGSGNQQITAGNGDNEIYGGDGDDIVLVGFGDNHIYAGAGNYQITAGTGSNTIVGGHGDETITAGLIAGGGIGGTGANSITGATGSNVVTVGDGANTITGGLGGAVIKAGVGGNFITTGDGNSRVYAGVLWSQLTPQLGGTGANSIIGGHGDDVFAVGDGANTVLGGTGNNQIYAGFGANSIAGGVGDDSIYTGVDWTQAGLAYGALTSSGAVSNIHIVGTAANKITGGTVSNLIEAGDGANVISGGGGGNVILAGVGANHILSGDGNSRVYAGVLWSQPTPKIGGTGQNTITGGKGADVFVVGDGSNTITGGAGDSSTYAGVGANSIYGGVGDDSIYAGVNWSLAATTFGTLTTSGSVTNLHLTGTGANTITGGAGNMLIEAADGANSIHGGVGNDTIAAGVGANTISGGVGDDRIFAGVLWSSPTLAVGGVGANSISGGQGADTMVVGDGANSVQGGTGNMSIYAGVGSNDINGGTGDDSIYAGVQWSSATLSLASGGVGSLHLTGTGVNVIDGGKGNMLIEAADGANSITGGQGDDTIEAGVGANTISGGVGTDSIVGGVLWSSAKFAIGGTGANSISGGTGADTIEAGDGANSISGGQGDMLIEAGVGANSIHGGSGNMTIIAGVLWPQATLSIGGTGANTIDGGVGNMLIEAGNGANTIHGGQGDDVIKAGVGANTILGGVGKDFIAAGVLWSAPTLSIGGTGANSISGGTGNDTIYAGDGANTIVGGTGNDLILAGVGSNSITGGFGNMTIYAGVIWTSPLTVVGGTGANTIYGGTGNDFIEAGNGDNIIDGGIGDDIILSGFGDSSIIGGTGDDQITVKGGHNVIETGTGNTTVVGGAGSDVIHGGDGNISVLGGAGADTITLGDGNDTVVGGGADVVITVGDGANLIHGGAGNSTIEAGAGDNLIFGGAGKNWIADGAGHATIQGGGGNETIYGGALASVIVGGQGDDVIVGGAGGNIIVGSAGDNTIQGGAGGDTIYGGGGDNKLYSGGGAAKIYGDHATLAFALSAVGVLSHTAIAGPSGAVNGRATIVGGSGPDSLYGGAGSDSIYGGSGTRLIVGGRQTTYIQGGVGAGVTIQGGDAGDVIIGSDGGHDSIVGGAGNNRIELRGAGNSASNGAGYGVIVGGEGADSLTGGTGGENTLVGGAASDVLTAASSLDTVLPDAGASAGYAVTGDALSSPTAPAVAPTLSLPGDAGAQGWWSLVAGPAGLTLGGDESDAGSPAIVADAAGPYVAWTQTSGGAKGLYVAHDVNGVWTAVGGATTGPGLSLAGASASNPAMALVNSAPVVAWTSTTSAGRAIEVASLSSGHWVGLGSSDAAGGISGVGAFDDAQIVATAAGPVVTWRDLSGPSP